MASMYQEWVKQRYAGFGAAAGEVVYVGDPIDVGDWSEIQIQMGQARCARTPGARQHRAGQ